MDTLPSEIIKIIKYYTLESPYKKELLNKVYNNYNIEIIHDWNLISEVLTCYNITRDIYTVFSNSITITDYEYPDHDDSTKLNVYIVYIKYIYEEY